MFFSDATTVGKEERDPNEHEETEEGSLQTRMQSEETATKDASTQYDPPQPAYRTMQTQANLHLRTQKKPHRSKGIHKI